MQIEIIDTDLSDPAHAKGVIAVLDSYAREPVGGKCPLNTEVRDRLIPGLQAQSNVEILLAFASAGPVGVAVCFIGFSTFAAKPLLNLHDLAVLPEYRGREIGRSLLSAVESRARERGCCKVTLEVREDNRGARKLYRSFGFSDFAPGEEETPTLFLQKRL